jgi:serine/threonine protein kinase
MIPESTKVKVIDFGGATYDSERKSCVVNTRQYRAPEVILGLGWSMPSDLWSAACILVELYVGELLFATHDNLEHLALIQKIVAPFPPNVLSRAKNVSLVKIGFDSKGFHRMDRVLSPDSVSYVSSVKPLESIIRPEDGRFLDLIRRLLIVNPDDRASAQACSRHKF